MADIKRKIDTIRRIEHLQLPQHLICALEHDLEAEAVTEALNCLEQLREQWS